MKGAGPQMRTTRGTYVAPQARKHVPQAMHEFVAPSLSVARPSAADHVTSERVYSPLVPFAAAQAAHVMSHAIAPLMGDGGATRMSPGLRSVLTAMLERAARTQPAAEAPATRSSTFAPEMVTPPAPRPEAMVASSAMVAPSAAPSLLEERAQQV